MKTTTKITRREELIEKMMHEITKMSTCNPNARRRGGKVYHEVDRDAVRRVEDLREEIARLSR